MHHGMRLGLLACGAANGSGRGSGRAGPVQSQRSRAEGCCAVTARLHACVRGGAGHTPSCINGRTWRSMLTAAPRTAACTTVACTSAWGLVWLRRPCTLCAALQAMLTYDPMRRITARQALRHTFFQVSQGASTLRTALLGQHRTGRLPRYRPLRVWPAASWAAKRLAAVRGRPDTPDAAHALHACVQGPRHHHLVAMRLCGVI